MKSIVLSLRISTVVVVWAAMGETSPAQTVAVNLTSDLILGFRATGGTGATLNLEVDLGPASQFYNATPGQIINLSGVNGLALKDISGAYGDNWSTRTDLFFGIIGGTGRSAGSADGHVPARTVWASAPETTAGTQSTPWLRQSSQSQGFASSDIESLYAGPPSALSSQLQTSHSTVSALVNYDGTVQTLGSWTSEDLKAQTSSFHIFNPTIDIAASRIGAAGNSLLDGTSYAVLDLYELQPSSAAGQAGVLIGAFGLNSAGNLVFDTNPGVFTVPEPGSAFLLMIGGGLSALLRRRSRPGKSLNPLVSHSF